MNSQYNDPNYQYPGQYNNFQQQYNNTSFQQNQYSEQGNYDQNSRNDSRNRDRGRSERGNDRGRDRGEKRGYSDDRERYREDKRRSPKRDSKERKKSPEKTERKRTRPKVSLWDKAPIGFEIGTVQAPLNLANMALNPHQNRQARRLYVGNIPPTVSDIQLADFFNTAMFAAGATKNSNPNPVVAVQMNHDKSFAFVEFSCLEDASAGMGFDGITLQGHSLKVRRPKDYKQGPSPDDKESGSNSGSSNIPNIVSTNVQEGPNKIFIGGLPAYLNEEQIKQLVSAFGQLKSFNLVKDTVSGISKGFAFFDYMDPNVTDRACQGLNAMKIGDKSILVQRANVGAKQSPTPTTTSDSLISNPTAYNFLNLGMPIAAAMALLGLNVADPGPATRILLLINLASPEDLLNEEEYNEILEDTREEMRKFGTVLSITAPRPPKPLPKEENTNNSIQDQHAILPTFIPWGAGKIFVEFKRKEEADKAQRAVAGRKYNGRQVLSGFYSEEKYAKREWAPDPEEEKNVAEKFKKELLQKDQEEIEKIRRTLQEDVDEMEAQEKLNQLSTNKID